MTISVIGVGGVGGYFGGKLSLAMPRLPGLNVVFLARGEHLAVIKRKGLTLDAEEGVSVCFPSIATDRVEELPPSELYLLCVKGYDLDEVCISLAPRLPAGASVMPLLNGVDIAERVKRLLPRAMILPACVYVGTKIEKPGVVKQRGGEARIIFGPERPGLTVDARIAELFTAAGIRFELKDDPWPEIWMKYLFIASYSLVCAEADATLGQAAASGSIMGKARSVMGEIAAIARAKGTNLPADAVERTAAKARDFPPAATTSFHRDYADPSRRDERDIMGGAILRMGKELSLPVPVTAEIHAELVRRKPSPPLH